MADREIIYGVKIDATDLKSQGDAIIKQIDQLRAEQAALNVTTAEGSKAFKENQQVLKLLEQQQKLNQKQLGALTEEEKKNTDQTNFNNNSIKQNRELLKELNAEYIRLQKPTAEQTARVKILNDTLKQQEAAIGDNRRNVGNYKESLQDLISQLPVFGKGLEGIGNGFRAIGASNPFGLILQLLTPLIQSFLKLEPVTNTINGVFASISAVITTVVSSVKDFFDLLSSGGGLTDSFSSAFGGLGDKIGTAATESYNLVQALDDLEDSERRNQATMAQTNRDVAILIAQSRDRTKSEQERISLLERANELEELQLQRELRISNERVAVRARELANIIRNGGDRDKAEQDLADAQQKRFEAEQAAGVQTEKNQGRINVLLEEEQKIRAKNEEEREKQRQLEAKDSQELLRMQFEIAQKLQAIRDGIREKEENEELERLEKQQEESQRLADARVLEYELFLENEVQTAQTAEEFRAARINQIKEESRIKLQDTKLTEEQRRKITIDTNNALKKVNEEYFKATIQGYDAVASTLQGLSVIAGEQTEIGKQLAIISTTISTYTAAQKAYEATIGIPFVGPFLAPINAAIAIVQGFLRVKNIAAVQVPQFAGGGFTGSGFGSADSSGFKPAGIVHEGEYVVKKSLVPTFAPEIARIEKARVSGLGSYANGGLVADRVTNDVTDFTALVDAIKQIRPVVSVQEITDIQNNLDYYESSTKL